MKHRWLYAGATATLIGVGIAIAVVGATPRQRPMFAGTGPSYVWNEPFLDWPQTGDMACETEGGTCESAERSVSPEARAQAKPLVIDVLMVPVGDPGRHELVIGDLVLPDGIHTRTYFKIANADTKSYRVAQTHVEFVSLEPGAPPFSEFAGQRPEGHGPERVKAILVWTTDWALKDATMEIADLVVE